MNIRKLLKVAATVVFILVVILAATVFYLSRPKTRYQFVSKTVLIQPQINTAILTADGEASNTEWKEQRRLARSRCINILQKNHSLETSSGISLIIDFYSPGKFTMIDDESYRRLTISIKAPAVNKTYDASSDEIQLYYSSGGAAWVMQCAGYYATKANGTIILTRMDKDIIKASMNLHGKAAHASHPEDKENFSFTGNYTFLTANLGNINGWAAKWDEFSKHIPKAK